MTQCPCGSGSDFDDCCGPILSGDKAAPTAEALMRSRYTAYVKGVIDHIERTHAPEASHDFDRKSAEVMSREVQWTGLTINETVDGGEGDETGIVEFTAAFIEAKRPQTHHERSTFRRVDGQWAYVDGKINPGQKPRRVEKVGRNDPCPCGSGKKYKKCCGA